MKLNATLSDHVEAYYAALTTGGDPDAELELLTASTALLRYIEHQQDINVRHARAAGLTWQEVADVLGVTRQGAQQRYGN